MGKPVPEKNIEDIYRQTDAQKQIIYGDTRKAITTILDENDPKSSSQPFSKVKRKRFILFETNPKDRKQKNKKIKGKKRKFGEIDGENCPVLRAKLRKLDEE